MKDETCLTPTGKGKLHDDKKAISIAENSTTCGSLLTLLQEKTDNLVFSFQETIAKTTSKSREENVHISTYEKVPSLIKLSPFDEEKRRAVVKEMSPKSGI